MTDVASDHTGVLWGGARGGQARPGHVLHPRGQLGWAPQGGHYRRQARPGPVRHSGGRPEVHHRPQASGRARPRPLRHPRRVA
eukprot:5753240-Pyramimonas_sp.AAC.1